MIRVRIIKDWSFPDLLRQTPGGQGIWDDIQFILDPVPECDYLILLNNKMQNDIHIRCARENVWAIMQEPYVKGVTDWMVRRHGPFGRVYTNHPPLNRSRYRASHPAVPWHVSRTIDQLTSISAPLKPKAISWITSNLSIYPGHKKRLAFLKAIQEDGSMDIDVMGRGICYIEDKWDGLAPYKYSLAIENHSGPDYWTEKLADCFLSWTIPIYYGCTNLEDYFPAESFIWIDIDQPKLSIARIKSILEKDDWMGRFDALEEARNRYLYQHQFFPFVTKQILSDRDSCSKTVRRDIIIPAYKDPWIHRAKKKLIPFGFRTVFRKR